MAGTPITFQDPPGKGRMRWAPIAKTLRSHPGEWAIVAKGSRAAYTTAIKQAGLAAFAPAGAFEATARRCEGGKGYTIFARYVGTEADAA